MIWPRASTVVAARVPRRDVGRACPTATIVDAVDGDGAVGITVPAASIVTTVPPVTIRLTALTATRRPAADASTRQHRARSAIASNRTRTVEPHGIRIGQILLLACIVLACPFILCSTRSRRMPCRPCATGRRPPATSAG